MRTFCFMSDKCRSEAQSKGCLAKIERKMARIEAETGESLYVFGSIKVEKVPDRSDIYKLRFFKYEADNQRIIGIKFEISLENLLLQEEKVECYVFLTIFSHDDKYKTFHSPNTNSSKRNELVGLGTIEAWKKMFQWVSDNIIAKIQKSVSVSADDKCSLTEDERYFLTDATGVGKKAFRDWVYESKEWIEQTKNKFDDWQRVSHIIEEEWLSGDECFDQPKMYEYQPDCLTSMYVVLWKLVDDNSINFYLLGWGNKEVAEKIRNKWIEECKNNHWNILTTAGQQAMFRTCRRAYPIDLLIDSSDDWRKLMKGDNQGNLFFSDEEARLVKSENDSPHNFPLFIDGRAGSGKSTVLQFIFAEYLLRYLKRKNAVNRPLYISYSENLVEKAESVIRDILLRNKKYLDCLPNEYKGDESTLSKECRDSFSKFQHIVLNVIKKRKGGDYVKNYFPKDKYIGFAEFRKKWNNSLGFDRKYRKYYNAEICWHIIRSYIKGWNCEGYLTPSLFSQLGSDDKNVSQNTYEYVYENVWEKWYSKLNNDEHYWDDQDIVRYCLNSPDDKDSIIESSYSGIFCDESQDFTHIELEFIFRLSIFSKRKFDDQLLINRVPFVFVGDEYQTINPTGFSWKVLRSYFTQDVLPRLANDNIQVRQSEDSFHSLTKNYRSTPPIVKLGNSIQLLRQLLLDNEVKIDPQQSYYSIVNETPVYHFMADDEKLWTFLKERAATLIIPCSNGQECQEYIQSDSVLRKYIHSNEDGSYDISVYCPMEIKGLETDDVVVYGFGHSLSRNKMIGLLSSEDKELSDKDKIDIKYLLNNIYVAVTRAKKNLFILEPRENNDSFWTLINSKDIHSVLERPDNKTTLWSEDSLGFVLPAETSELQSIDSEISNFDKAKNQEDNAESTSNPRGMRQAAARYQEQKMYNDARRCRGKALMMEEDYCEAAKEFLAINEEKYINLAIICYWHALEKNDTKETALVALNKLIDDGYDNNLPCKAINLLSSNNVVIKQVNELLYQILALWESKESDEWTKLLNDTTDLWQTVLNDLLHKVKVNFSKNSDREVVRKFLDGNKRLSHSTITLDQDLLARWYCQLNDKRKAIEIWEGAFTNDELLKNKIYLDAKLVYLEYPSNLEFLDRLERYDSIVSEYTEHKEVFLDSLQQTHLIRALVQKKDFQELQSIIPKWLISNQALQDKRQVLQKLQSIDNDRKYHYLFIESLLCLRNDVSVSDHLEKIKVSNIFYEKLESLLLVKSSAFEESLKKVFESKNKRSKDKFNLNSFQKYEKTIWYDLILCMVGALVEKQERFVEMFQFYEYALSITSDPKVRLEFRLRWISAKERFADFYHDSKIQSEVDIQRNKWGISRDHHISPKPVFPNWDKLFEDILNSVLVSTSRVPQNYEQFTEMNDITQTIPEMENSETEMKSDITETHISNQTKNTTTKLPSNKKVTIECMGYKFNFAPNKYLLELETVIEDETMSGKFKEGKLSSSDFEIGLENRLLLTSDKSGTPFVVVNHTLQEVRLLHTESGLELCFPNPVSNDIVTENNHLAPIKEHFEENLQDEPIISSSEETITPKRPQKTVYKEIAEALKSDKPKVLRLNGNPKRNSTDSKKRKS